MGRLFVLASESENTTTKLMLTSNYSLKILMMSRRVVVPRSLAPQTLHHLAPSSLFAPCTYQISDGQISNGPDRKVACSIRDDFRELSYFSMIVERL
jgi:hypothetical protein